MRESRWLRCSLAVALPLLLGACIGQAEWSGSMPTSDRSPDEALHPPVGGSSPQTCNPSAVTPSTRFQRLATLQYRNTLRELLGVEVTTAFEEEASETGYETSNELVFVGTRQLTDYQASAEEVAAQVVASPTLLDRLLSCSPAQDAGCARSFVESFGLRAFRRPLVEAEVQAYLQLHAKGRTLFTEGDDFQRGVRLVLEAMLQAPDILYRTELTEDPDGDGVAALGGYELAARLSYSLWNSTPDDELLAAARDGRLDTPEGVRAQAERLVRDPRANQVLTSFHGQWLRAERYPELRRDPAHFPDFTPELLPDLRAELDSFVLHQVQEQRAGLETLLTAPMTFANERLGRIYGLSGLGEELLPVDLPAAQRSGLLTQVGFLAANSHGDTTDPIHRGLFLLERVLCTSLGVPPTGAADLRPPDFGPDIRTTRDRISALTAAPACLGCHRTINAAGFAFEHYDSTGAWRTTERLAPIDASGVLTIDGKEVAFSDAIQLIAAVSKSTSARQCYTTHWLRYTSGRMESAAERCDVERLGESLARPDYPVQQLLVDLTQTRSFLHRFGD